MKCDCGASIPRKRVQFLKENGVSDSEILCCSCQTELENRLPHHGKVHAHDSTHCIAGGVKRNVSARSLVTRAQNA